MALPATRPVESYGLTPVLMVPDAGGVLLHGNLLSCVTYDNDSNESTLTFRLSRADPRADLIKEEMPVLFKGRTYRARTVTVSESRRDSYVEVYCERIWYNLMYAGQIDAQWVSATATQLMTQALAGTGWSVGQVDTASTFGWDVEAGTVLNYLQQIAKIYGGYLVFDDVEMKVHLLSAANAGRDRGTTFTYYRGIKSVKRTSDTTSLVTRVYGKNAEGETIAPANGGVPYLENYTWTTEVRETTYDFASGTSPQAMKNYLTGFIAARSTPNVSYEYTLAGLADRIEEVDRFEVLDTVFVMDQDFDKTVKNRVTSLTMDYIDLRRSKITLGTRVKTLSNSGNASSPSNVPPALIRKPTPPNGLATSSFVYFDSDGTPRAELSAVFSPATMGTDGSPITITEHQLLGRRVVTPAEKMRVIASAPGSPNEITANGFKPEVPWEFQVRALASNGQVSAPTPSVYHTFQKDTTPPNTPAKPTATTRLGQVILTVTNLDNGTPPQPMPVDFAYFEVRMATTATGTSTIIGNITEPGTVVVPEQPYNQERWYSLVAVDTSGNRSGESARASAITQPLVDTDIIGRIIDGANLKLDSITLDVLAEPVRAQLESASGNNKNYYQATEPTGGTYKAGDLWFDTDNGYRISRWSGTAWVLMDFGADALASGAVTEAKIAANAITVGKLSTDLNNKINQASTDAIDALTTANGKNRIVRSASVPSSTTGFVNGDQWWRFNGTEIIGMWLFAGGAWVQQTLTDTVLTNIDAGSITVGILGADRIGARTITTDKLIVATLGNLIPNGSFERGLSGWSVTSGWVSADTVTDGPAGSGASTAVMRATPTASDQSISANGFRANTGLESSTYTPGASYQFRLVGRYTSATPPSDAFVRVRIGLHGDGATNQWIVPEGVQIRPFSTTRNAWYTVTGTYTAPENNPRDRMSVSVHFYNAAGVTFEIAEVAMRLMASAELVVDGAITADKLAANSVVAGKIAADSVTAREIVAGTITAASGILANASVGTAQIADLSVTSAKLVSIDAGKITTGFLNAARIDAKTIAATKIAIGDFTNLALDMQSEREREAYPAQTNWRYAKSSTASPGGAGAPWVLVQDTGAGSYSATRVGEDFAVKPGEQIFISYRANRRGADAPITLNLQVFGEDGLVVAQDVYGARAPSTAPQGTWVTYSGVATIPNGAAFARPMFKRNSASAEAAGDWLLFEPMIRRMTTGELLVDGAVIARTIATNAVTADAIAALQIEAGHIKSNAITADKINAGAVTTVKLASNAITTDKLDATAITAKHTITGAVFQTTATVNRGIIIDSARFSAYNTSGVETVRINASDGSATFSGTLRNRPSGARVEILSSDTVARIRLHTNTTGVTPAMIMSDPSGEGMLLYSGVLSGKTRMSTVQLYELSGTDTYPGWGIGAIATSGNSWTGAYITGNASGSLNMTSTNFILTGGVQRVWTNDAGNMVVERTTAHRMTMNPSGYTQFTGTGVQVYGDFAAYNGSKAFIMDHPTKPGKTLQHVSTESPMNGVEYWSDGLVEMPQQGYKTVVLPEYFEALTAPDHRVAILTPGSPDANLWAEPIKDGRLIVHGTPGALFSWVVKARRVRMVDGVDQLAFDVVADASLMALPDLTAPDTE